MIIFYLADKILMNVANLKRVSKQSVIFRENLNRQKLKFERKLKIWDLPTSMHNKLNQNLGMLYYFKHMIIIQLIKQSQFSYAKLLLIN